MKRIDITGERFGRLLVIGATEERRNRQILWSCICDCGKYVSVIAYSLRSGNTSSCGCFQLEKVTKHGHTTVSDCSPAYSVWKGMKARCLNRNSNKFHLYGGRGITVCDDWMTFEGFYKDMGDKPRGKSIDRIDGNKGYYPENCRWATIKEQNSHLSSTRSFSYNGRQISIAEISEITGIKHHSIDTRMRLGWSIERIIETPLKTSKRWHDV